MAQTWFEKTFKPIRHGIEYGFYRFLLFAVPLIPRKCLPALARFGAWVGTSLVFWEARKGRVNLDIAFGDTLSKSEKDKILRKSFENLILTALYFPWFKYINPGNVQEFAEFPEQSAEVIDQVRKRNQGGIAIVPHYGNWELMGLIGGYLDIPRLHIIVRQLKNPLLDGLINRYRSFSGNRIIERQQAMIKSLRALRDKELLIVVFDQSIDPTQGGTFAPYFGLPAATTKAAATLSLRTGAPIFPAYCVPVEKGRYRIQFDPIIEYQPEGDFEKDVQKINRILQSTAGICHPETTRTMALDV